MPADRAGHRSIARVVVAGLTLMALWVPAACAKTDAPTDTSSGASSDQRDAGNADDAGAGGAAAPGADDVAPAKKIFKEDDTTIKVAVGEKFGIRVKENASIGDAWKMVSEPDDRVLQAEGDTYKTDAGEAATGSGGQREFKFKARRAGTTTLTLFDCYRCSSSGQVSPESSAYARRITFTVTVG